MDQQTVFQQLVRPWCDRLYGVAMRYTGRRETAEDWVQETLLRAWRDFDQLSEQIATYAWLLKILDHVIADDVRKQKRRHQLAPVITTEDRILHTHQSAEPGPFEETLRQQDSEQLAAAVQALPEDYARVVMLRDIEGLSYRDVAEILAIPKGTVMSRLSRGRRLLAKTLLAKARKDGHTDRIRIHPGKER
ncbi:MAG TPA: sigma-70 family RNA polymerase sigma factor [Thiolapillus brandeum]|uniref:Sigma-70 family RNA polymerase sigma factor n=1 Tax=Thiolapillus brandeum TaxID=1076588 RepID=A0A831WFC5_9GAMM|nr:sigma-70 family RNA polymerase sigma factor [Thiolapillus brandeum]